MTDKEAINELSFHCIEFQGKPKDIGNFLAAVSCGSKALEEIQQYREIGTIEELVRAKRYIYLAKKHGTIGQMIDECVAYEEIGTVEECREAVEKQKAKIPDYEGDGYADGYMVYDTWICPCCGECYEVDYDDYEHCPKCGQAIDWSDEE